MSRPTGKLFGWALALLVAGVFTSLGVWQLGRAKQKDAMLAASQQVLAQRHALPLSAASDPARAVAYDWAGGSGHFPQAAAVLLDNQTRDGRPGIRAYRVFVPDAGGVPLLVELGWLPLPGNRQLPAIGTIPGPVQLAGLLAPPPSAGVMRPCSTACTPLAMGSSTPWRCASHFLAITAAATRMVVSRALLRPPPRGSRMPYFCQYV